MATKTECAKIFEEATHWGDKHWKAKEGTGIACKTNNSKIIAHNKDNVTYKLHNCPIVEVDKKKRIATLTSCGYETKTTKDHLNLALKNLGVGKRVSQKKKIWYLNGEKFKDEMKIKY